MGFISSIFGSGRAIEAVSNVVEGALGKEGLLDNAFFTDQEKSQVGLEGARIWLEVQKTLASENSIRSITRRIMAWAVLGNFLLVLNTGIVLLICGKTSIVEAIQRFVIDMKFAWMAVTVVAFYFLYYGAKKLLDDKKES